MKLYVETYASCPVPACNFCFSYVIRCHLLGQTVCHFITLYSNVCHHPVKKHCPLLVLQPLYFFPYIPC